MKGAWEYAQLFPNPVQYGKLYLLPGFTEKGRTFEIWVLPEGESVTPEASPLNSVPNAVLVYGVISGSRSGIREEYGWVHRGKWVEDFEKLVKEARDQLVMKLNARRLEIEEAEKEERLRIRRLLDNY